MISYIRAAAVAAALGVVAPVTASAADMPEVIDATTSPFDIAFGVKGTSEWVLRGISQTKGDPAVQGYAELQAYGMLYAGIWASNVNFGGSDPSTEIDYYGGVRHSFGQLSLDAGYVWVDFNGDRKGFRELDYGKVYGIVKFAVTDNFEVGGNVYYGSDFINLGAEIVHATASAKYKIAPFDAMPNVGLYVSGNFSRQWTSKNFSPDYYYWDAGVGATYKAMTLDFRYSDSDLSRRECFRSIGQFNSCGDRYVVSLAFDTSLSKLK